MQTNPRASKTVNTSFTRSCGLGDSLDVVLKDPGGLGNDLDAMSVLALVYSTDSPECITYPAANYKNSSDLEIFWPSEQPCHALGRPCDL